MPKQIELLEKSKKSINVSLDGYIIDKINDLLKTGDFNGVSSLVRAAILELHRKYEIEGKLRKPPEDAQERIKNAQLIEEREVEIE